jgi:hypothetical protein
MQVGPCLLHCGRLLSAHRCHLPCAPFLSVELEAVYWARCAELGPAVRLKRHTAEQTRAGSAEKKAVAAPRQACNWRSRVGCTSASLDERKGWGPSFHFTDEAVEGFTDHEGAVRPASLDGSLEDWAVALRQGGS